LVRQYDTAAQVAARLSTLLGTVTEIDLGGGFGCPYARDGVRQTWPALRGRIEQVLDEHLPHWRSPGLRISFESGRYLAGDCGVLLGSVLDVKVSKEQTFVVLDTGINHLGGMVGLRRLPPILPTVLSVGGPADGGTRATTIVGPLCTPLDTFVRGAQLPAMTVGQVVAVPNVGAYGLTASLLAFLGHRPPVEVICDGDIVQEVSRLHISRTFADIGTADLTTDIHALA
jgi:diaminopimelate decarboxylase